MLNRFAARVLLPEPLRGLFGEEVTGGELLE